MRILTICHNHPALHPGGAEILAHDLFRDFATWPGVTSYFLAAIERHYRSPHPGTSIQARPGEPNVFLYRGPGFEPMAMLSRDLGRFAREIGGLLRDLAPDVVVVHHLNGFGVELLALLRRSLPRAKLLFVAHDLYLVCPNDGLMVSPRDDRLCERQSHDACRQCFPERPVAFFQARRADLLRHLELVDWVIAPSRFLAARLRDWGVPAAKLRVIGNGLPGGEVPDAAASSPACDRFAVFGNQRRTKGTLVILEAARRLLAGGFDRFSLHLYGEPLFQPPEFVERLEELCAGLAGVVVRHGRYDRARATALMAANDWIAMPSTWWENAPLTIREAQAAGRPVLVSDVGGMAESVADGVTGRHVAVGDPQAWADAIAECTGNTELWDRLAANLPAPRGIAAVAAEYRTLFGAAA
ncbi:MAG: glycosyltransferase [Thalassobaculum sp.]|uniref:glycosyltransferase n=1 Tax=Thalassobaculum sp. TaxID=2022740 RepID=UPI0032ECB163